MTERSAEEAEGGRHGLLPGDEGRRTEKRGEERTENEEEEKKEEEEQEGPCMLVFQVQGATGHNVQAIPPTVPP